VLVDTSHINLGLSEIFCRYKDGSLELGLPKEGFLELGSLELSLGIRERRNNYGNLLITVPSLPKTLLGTSQVRKVSIHQPYIIFLKL
jgi:hypothetical protein